MTETNTAPTRSTLSLKGSSKIVSEFFEYSINSILYQRGVYPADDFKMVKKYGLNMLVTTDTEVKAYIRKIIKQLHKWIEDGKISKLVIAIVSKDTLEVLERWQFDVEIFKDDNVENKKLTKNDSDVEKSEKEIHTEIQAIIRQITASVTFLPQFEGRCTFNVLVYTDCNSEVPDEWGDSDAREISNAEQVKLRSFSTDIHKVDLQVAYKLADD
ncbi:hypothetical protein T552_03126 [Pneumocystis carinii B80]|uniref:HORMA domain-containing protein n=1 Tax=Pneumocystis carinii (strain B80) TaxID=1408658 RepID=A0A0W4ZBU4_PNEC8|nr:hypothetical protein T552_03126 [Pneumocystis carinii B80]KTW25853.1 hypothetical protein T552_03126 [Pneumocystis carinii B80]